MKLHKDSHVDHGLTGKQLAHVLLTFEGRDAFFIETITLPAALGSVPCALFGPIMGDLPIPSAFVTMKPRGDRKHPSRVLTKREPVGTDWIMLPDEVTGARSICVKRESNRLTVIAGPHDSHPCVLFTAFGGPLAPKEVAEAEADLASAIAGGMSDETIESHRDTLTKSIAFWSEHALVEVG